MCGLNYLIGEMNQTSVNRSRLANSKVGLVGVGGSTSILECVCRAGVRNFVLVDDDVVEQHNIRRQGHERVGTAKVASATMRIHGIQPEADVVALQKKFALDDTEVCNALRNCDLVIFATDNSRSQLEGNKFVLKHKLKGLWIGLTSFAKSGEVVWYHPSIHDDCMRCILERRFYDETKIADPTSESTDFADIQIIDGIASHIAFGLLTDGENDYFGSLIRRLGKKQFLEISLRNFLVLGETSVRKRLGIDPANDVHFAYCTRFEDTGKRLGPCPDCVEILGRVFDPTEFVAEGI